jgi:hypothetical protein
MIERAVAFRSPSELTGTGLLCDCLEQAGIDPALVPRQPRLGLRDLYGAIPLPIRLTLGAAAALHIAQRSADIGLPGSEVLANARRVGGRVVAASGDPLCRSYLLASGGAGSL